MAQANEIIAGRAGVIINGDITQLRNALDKAQMEIGKLGDSFVRVGSRMTAAGAAIVGPLALMTRNFISSGDAIDKAAKRAQVGARFFAGLALVADHAGVSAGELEIS